MLWWQIASGNFSPYDTDNVVLSVNDGNVDYITKLITSQSNDMVCINDPDGDVDFETLSQKLKDAFEKILPEKSEFEK